MTPRPYVLNVPAWERPDADPQHMCAFEWAQAYRRKTNMSGNKTAFKATRDMREAAHEYVSANLGHSGSYCKHCGGTPLENAAMGQSNYCPKAPTPAPKPDQHEVTMRSADEIQAEITRIQLQPYLNNYDDTRILALEWVLAPYKPQESK